MKSPPRPRLRHCPLCGIAMQGRKSQDHLADFDTFECQTCHTSIRVTGSQGRKPASE